MALINEIDIYNFLRSYIEKEIIYIPNPGNAGDSLIAYATLQIFDKIGLNYTIGKYTTKYNDKLLFYAGGGNLVQMYSNCKSFLKNNMFDNKIVILPHTIKDKDELIKDFNNNIIVICRERISYNYVYNLIPNKNNVFLSKDMAFYIDDIEKYKSISGTGICNCFRVDSEKTNIEIPVSNIDLPSKLNVANSTSNKNIIKDVSLSIFNYLSKYDTINTNRLHMAIAGSLLNKYVNFYPNSYYKNTAVYEYSIKDNFINTKYEYS